MNIFQRHAFIQPERVTSPLVPDALDSLIQKISTFQRFSRKNLFEISAVNVSVGSLLFVGKDWRVSIYYERAVQWRFGQRISWQIKLMFARSDNLCRSESETIINNRKS